MEWRIATAADSRVLAELNHQLIADEGHRNSMNVDQLERRMLGWLSSEYRAVLFVDHGAVVSYALFRDDEGAGVYLRQFFVVRDRRRQGIGRRALQLFRDEVVPRGTRIVVDVLTRNHAGRSFWTATGFREYAVTLERLPGDDRSS